MLTGDGWITIAVIVGMVILMAANLAGPDLVLIAGVTVLLLAGIIGAVILYYTLPKAPPDQ